LLVSTKDGIAHWHKLEGQAGPAVPPYEGDIHKVLSVDLSPNRDLAALGLPSGSIQRLEIATSKPAGPPLEGHAGPARSLVFSPSGDKLASGGSDKSVMVWDMKTGKGLAICKEHKGAVFALAISPGGETLASGCGAGTIKLWNFVDLATNSFATIPYHK